MLRSMYSGISGMKVNQTKLDVIGNNIANVNTTGFKSSRARFSDTLNQSVSNAMAPSQNKGGVNASQVGLGVQLASIDSVMTQGSLQPTGRPLDIAIDGEGFFMVSSGPVIYGDGAVDVNHNPGTHTISGESIQNSGAQLMYSRDGSFILDNEGNLLTGDGYRVMGYSLTNDDNSIKATAQGASQVTAANLEFNFGPGTQLNGYKVVLGEIGPATATSATVNKNDKLIVVNGDFSTIGAISAEQVEAAIAKGLSSAGISQTVKVGGTPINYAGLGSEQIRGGSDALSPKSLSFAGFKIAFDTGSELNGYTFQIGEVSSDILDVNIDKDSKKIIVSGSFIEDNTITSSRLMEQINAELIANGIEQTVTNVTGTQMPLSQVKASSNKSLVSQAPVVTSKKGDASAAVTNPIIAGFKINVDTTAKGNDLNGYSIKVSKTTTTGANVSIDTSDKTIVISGSFDTVDLAALNASIADKLTKAGITDSKFTVSGAYDDTAAKDTLYFTGGVDSTSAGNITIGGFTLTLPTADQLVAAGKSANYLDELDFVISDLRNNDGVTFNSGIVSIAGDFATPNGITKADLAQALNDKLGLTGDAKIKVSGQNKTYTGLESDEVTGGEELKTPIQVEALGLKFTPRPGSSLNGYTIKIGTITTGTKTEVSISEKSKTITINGDFVTGGALTSKAIENALNKALEDANIQQAISVTGNPNPIHVSESQATSGGTSVQSIDESGDINFVDGTKSVKAYDGSLKTLKIPNKVKVAGSEKELAVKAYTIDSSGIINATLEDGSVAALGQIAMASFKNPEGLTKLGGNLYGESVNSGDPVVKSGVGTTGEDNSKGYGDNLNCYLEMSNVDLAEQFTDMIVSTRAFQASSKMISTGDEVLTEIINLKR